MWLARGSSWCWVAPPSATSPTISPPSASAAPSAPALVARCVPVDAQHPFEWPAETQRALRSEAPWHGVRRLFDGLHPGCSEGRHERARDATQQQPAECRRERGSTVPRHCRRTAAPCEFDGRLALAELEGTGTANGAAAHGSTAAQSRRRQEKAGEGGRRREKVHGSTSTQGRLLLYARENPSWGNRFVQASTSTDGGASWGPFERIVIDGYDLREGNIYFFAPVAVASRLLLAVFPVVHKRRACLAVTASRDGLRWCAPAPLLPECGADLEGQRAFDHPAASFVSRGSELILYVQRDVPGIGHPDQGERPSSRVELYAIPRRSLVEWATRSLRVAEKASAETTSAEGTLAGKPLAQKTLAEETLAEEALAEKNLAEKASAVKAHLLRQHATPPTRLHQPAASLQWQRACREGGRLARGTRPRLVELLAAPSDSGGLNRTTKLELLAALSADLAQRSVLCSGAAPCSVTEVSEASIRPERSVRSESERGVRSETRESTTESTRGGQRRPTARAADRARTAAEVPPHGAFVVCLCLPDSEALLHARVCEPSGATWQNGQLGDAWGASRCLQMDVSALARWLLRLRERSPYVGSRDVEGLAPLKPHTPQAAEQRAHLEEVIRVAHHRRKVRGGEAAEGTPPPHGSSPRSSLPALKKRCAFVGGGHDLRCGHFGAAIDASDFVIRANAAQLLERPSPGPRDARSPHRHRRNLDGHSVGLRTDLRVNCLEASRCAPSTVQGEMCAVSAVWWGQPWGFESFNNARVVWREPAERSSYAPSNLAEQRRRGCAVEFVHPRPGGLHASVHDPLLPLLSSLLQTSGVAVSLPLLPRASISTSTDRASSAKRRRSAPIGATCIMTMRASAAASTTPASRLLAKGRQLHANH